MQITLANLAEATPQQVFDQVVKHMLTQNKKSSSEDGGCFYRGAENTMCAAGCLIADSEYVEKMDSMTTGTSWGDLIHNNLAPPEHSEFIKWLQHIHDDYEPEKWREALQETANNRNLEFNA